MRNDGKRHWAVDLERDGIMPVTVGDCAGNGETATNWQVRSLREAGVSLIDCDHRTPPASDHGYPYIAIPQLKHGRIDLSDVRRINHDCFVDWTRKAKPQPYDVILSRRCNPGETAVVPAGLDCALGQNLVLLRASENTMHPPFLRWLTRGPHWWEQVGKFLNVGAVFDSLKCADIPNFRLPIPPISEQKAIAQVLGALDDKIELNRRINETLEAVARGIFRCWFVDFDPVRAKAAGRKPVGLDAATAALFPAALQDSPVGPVPKGWEVRPLDQIATFLNGLALQKYPAADKDFLPAIKIAELHRGNTVGSDKASVDIPADYVVGDGDILFSWSGSLEVVIWCAGPGALNQHLFKVTSSQYPRWFIYHWTKEHLPEFQAIAADKATTMGHIQRHHLTEALVVVPPEAMLQAGTRLIEPMMDLIVRHNLESRTLATTRDALLPKLLSGEVRVRDAEHVVGRAV